jgi:hypothetical protein
MNEWNEVLRIPLRFIPTILFAICYAIGGRGPKLVRRILGPILMFAAFFLIDWFAEVSYALLNVIPFSILMVGLFMGYGGDTFLEKIFRRTLYGLVLGVAGLAFAFIHNAPMLGLYQLQLALIASAFFGMFNPVSAVHEETIIATLSVILWPFMI